MRHSCGDLAHRGVSTVRLSFYRTHVRWDPGALRDLEEMLSDLHAARGRGGPRISRLNSIALSSIHHVLKSDPDVELSFRQTHTHTQNHTVHSQAHSLTRLRTPATRGRVYCAGLLKPWACGGDLHRKNTIVPNRQTFEPLGGCWPSGLCFLPHLPASSSSPPPSSFSSLRQKSEFFMSERPGCKSKFKRFRSQ